MLEVVLKRLNCIVGRLVRRFICKYLDESEKAYAHSELFMDGELFVAVCEAPEAVDVSRKSKWQTMAFNVYEMSNEVAVRRADDALRKEGTVIDPLGPWPWNSWWIAI